ncbi:TetR/AcrR family transcriptional regulator C-terminal domain-containing protein [Cryptosporangium phraense]|uniref:GntR family transcriptional regulator n=1 Tax=Cryptosporangium phraense TaxID=2593070 RepID=A0A545AHW5_9ACTN|nr:TetR/AcrR family transcriptional regulator C-terminal domain-containing protein [Cryptosporangium phraense]TQS40906.1 GntR family transcriptional regulator [Cryptosporangium phraense]
MTPSARITEELRRRIESGELAPGDRLPSTRQITREWGVAMATATKVLTALRQAGLADAVPGVGTVVRARTNEEQELPPPGRQLPDPPQKRRRPTDAPLTRDRIVAAAIAIADADGMAELSMRRVAADLGVATMALYRYVPSKEDLVVLMLDAVFGDVDLIPDPEPTGWRSRLEEVARIQWDIYRKHRWMAGVLSFSRPQLVPRGMVHTEYAMATLKDSGLDPGQLLHAAVCLFNHVRSVALVYDEELRNQQDTGMDADEWMKGQDPYYLEVMATGRFPMMTALQALPDVDFSTESMFEWGLQRYLDGLQELIKN